MTRGIRKILLILATAGSTSFVVPGVLHAQESLCGPAPSLPTSLENDESIKGQLKGQADLLSKLVGKAELSGQVEAARKQLYQTSDQFFSAQKDAYLSYVFCLLVTRDNSLSLEQKLKALNTFKEPIPNKNTPEALQKNSDTSGKELNIAAGQSVLITKDNIVLAVIGHPFGANGGMIGIRLAGNIKTLSVGSSVEISYSQGSCSITLLELLNNRGGRFYLRC